MYWFQGNGGPATLQELQLDIVGFLAILGEGSVLANAQVLTLSRWIFLPRLIPAPQALMRPTRPPTLDTVPGHVTGIFSGNYKNSINHIGNIVCDGSNLPEHSVRVVNIKRTPTDKVIKARTIAPLTVVLFLGFFLSCLLLGLSIWREDGMSILATVLLSLLSSLIGYGNKWELKLPERKAKTDKVPMGDVVIRYEKGSFLVVRCAEEVARELYFAPESIHYMLVNGWAYRLISLVGTMMLMGGVVALANAQIQLQIAWAGSYMALGSAYWVVAALPNKLHWDYSCYTVTDERLSDSKKTKGYPSVNETFTQALWRAIVVSKNTDWVMRSNACPKTAAWKAWLDEARVAAQNVKATEDPKSSVKTWEIPPWDAQGRLAALLERQARKDQKEMFDEIKELEEV
ncbi:hypothetical protein DM02DRAFT_616491 [Periconia macrospinosa]|uniref:Uncharacterized protein n=1 Tax=Periconia macrospinosa TaxID=97972 RepID=A0A2V1DI51_9PLEO|nr:hypothetical protein DM02DRAFT_616491 [Periconia macrospinosa]